MSREMRELKRIGSGDTIESFEPTGITEFVSELRASTHHEGEGWVWERLDGELWKVSRGRETSYWETI